MNGSLILLLVYSALLVIAGLLIGRRVRSTGSFFVAGHTLGPGLLFSTLLAANIGAGSTVGAASLAYRDGLAAWWWVGSAAVGTLLLGLWLGPRMWREARRHDLRTVGDYLELRYGAGVRGVVASVLWLGTLAILAGQIIAVAWVLDAVAGIPKIAGCVLGGAVLTLYFSAGGLLTSAWVNLLQLVVLLTGFVLAIPLALEGAGGWTGLRELAPSEDYWGFTQGGASGLVFLPLLVPAFLISPGLLQKLFGARDERTVRLGTTACALALGMFACLPTLLGMAARARYPELANNDLALPVLLSEGLPLALGMLGLAAVFSAEISSGDAILFMLSTSLSRDLYQRFINPEASDRQVLRVARWAALAGGALGIGLAVLLPSVVAALSVFYALLGVCLFVPIVAGLHLRGGGAAEALSAIALGVLGLLAARYGPWAEALPNPSLVGLLASAMGFLTVYSLRLIWRRDG